MAWQRVDGEWVLLSLVRNELIGINEVGGRVWDLVDAERSLDEIARLVAAEFDVEHAVALRDVERFVAELVARGAIEISHR